MYIAGYSYTHLVHLWVHLGTLTDTHVHLRALIGTLRYTYVHLSAHKCAQVSLMYPYVP